MNDDDEPEIKITTMGCLGRCLNHIEIIDPNGGTYIIWMFVVTLAVLYNAWVNILLVMIIFHLTPP